MEINYSAPDGVRAIIDSLGRTEDVRFSPSNRRLAVAAFRLNAIAVFDIDIEITRTGKKVVLTRGATYSASCLSYPHGVDFIDDDTIVVASRSGDIPILQLPSTVGSGETRELSPIHVLRSNDDAPLSAPGSVSAVKTGRSLCELLVCNSGGDTVTRHVIERRPGGATSRGEILLEKWLGTPDGVSVSGDRAWIAISNHNAHNVMLYRNVSSLGKHTDPDGILRSVTYPHGVRFSGDGEHIFVADAGAPYVHVYARHGEDWQGVRSPAATIRTMDEATYLRGRANPKEGGPKGMDIDAGMNVLVTTCECQPLAFFDVSAILALASAHPQPVDLRQELHLLHEARQTQTLATEAHAARAQAVAIAAAAEARAAAAEAKIAKAKAKVRKAKAGVGYAVDRQLRRMAKPLRRLMHS